MPNRIIKESIQTSDTLASVSAEAERLFWRLVTAADDYGRFDARPHIVLGKCLAAFVGRVDTKAVCRWLDELEGAGLIRRYTVGGKPYLHLTTWDEHQRPPRAKAPKFPAPEDADDSCDHMTADDSNGQHVTADAPEIRDTGIGIRESGFGREIDAPPAGDAPTALSPDDVAEIWNQVCGDVLPRCQKLTDKRRKHVKRRIAESAERRSPDWWRSYFARIRASPFCCGENDRGWKADFEWAVRSEDVVTKVLEGKYDRKAREVARDDSQYEALFRR